jgi:DNA-binding MarR family transcriptional regulator
LPQSARRSLDRISSRAIIEQLAGGSTRISELAEPFSMTLTGFCKHVKVLERAGLVRRTRHGRDHTLELTPQPRRDVARWVLKYQQFWNARLDRLEHFL